LSASEVAFLALGLVLGLASGAALIEVLRARPPASREVRVTVAPNAIPARFATTLADPGSSAGVAGPAQAGPGDRRWHDDPIDEEAATAARRVDDPHARSAPAPAVAPTTNRRTAVPSAVISAVRPTPLPLNRARVAPQAAGGGRAMVAVPMSIEPDPLTAALRTTSAAAATRAMAGGVATAAVAASGGTAPSSVATATAGSEALKPTGAAPTTAARATAGATADAGDPSRAADRDRTAGTPATATVADPATTAAGPCAEERRIADERCALATRAREGAVTAAEVFRANQRIYDDHLSASEAAAAASDPRAVRTAKEAAQQRFRDARQRAATRDDVEGAARDWLAEINRINHETRDAASLVEKSRSSAAALALTLERLAVEADAARISADRADEACIAAREAVARCDEARLLDAAAARVAAAPATAPDGARSRPPAPIEPTRTPFDDEGRGLGESMGSRAGQDALILRILRGDRDAMHQAVAQLAGQEADGGRRWQARLGALADALIARSIEASAFEFPADSFFWSAFSQAQNRDITAGLSSLGFRFDGFSGWVDDRVPSQRDLSLAVGYAGLDPMRVRRWPNETEMQELLSGVRVAADEYVASAAGGLTLGELVSLLGRRADGLTELWNDWGVVRPVLLEGG